MTKKLKRADQYVKGHRLTPLRSVTSVKDAKVRWMPNSMYATRSIASEYGATPGKVMARGKIRFKLEHRYNDPDGKKITHKGEKYPKLVTYTKLSKVYTNPTYGEAWAEFRRMNTEYVKTTQRDHTTHIFLETFHRSGNVIQFGTGS